MAESNANTQQAELIRRMKSAGRASKVVSSPRHPKSMKANRWTMGRVDEQQKFSNGLPFMQWWVNPNECQWKMATRTTIEKISGGVVHHEWPQTGMGSNAAFKGSRFDQPTVSFSFQSGIITPGGYNDILAAADTSRQPPPGLGNFFDFLDLLDRPDVTADGSPNYINIVYATPLFGQRGIWLQGFFAEDGVSWVDNAENPNQVSSWGATFLVFNSQPGFNRLLENFEMLTTTS